MAAFLFTGGIVLFVFESHLPMPLPFLKVGLANISTVLSLLVLGNVEMVIIIVLRVIAGSLLTGTFMTTESTLDLAAGLVFGGIAFAAEGWAKDLFSPIGISLLGSFAYLVIQLVAIRFVLLPTLPFMFLLPQLSLFTLLGGVAIGWISLRLQFVMREFPA